MGLVEQRGMGKEGGKDDMKFEVKDRIQKT